MYYIDKTDTGWSEVNLIPEHLRNGNWVDGVYASPGGKKLFLSWYVGDWNLYYSDWDSVAGEWGNGINCGPNINDSGAEWACTMPDDTTLIYLSSHSAHITTYDSVTQSWRKFQNFPRADYFPFVSHWGIHVSTDLKKTYLALPRTDSLIDGSYYYNYDIFVEYKDTSTHSGYGIPCILNICFESDSIYFAGGNYVKRFEGFPVLTRDGKTMYFTADYDSVRRIYETHMVVDENGDSVITSINEEQEAFLPAQIRLYPAYPNPFNPSTVISYRLPVISNVKIKIYDSLGREITTLINEEQNAGEYRVAFDADKYNLPSGLYFIHLKTPYKSLSQKAVLIK